jgi:hypothetical protein
MQIVERQKGDRGPRGIYKHVSATSIGEISLLILREDMN